MNWFRRRQAPLPPPLVSPPQGGEEIVLDEDELHAVSELGPVGNAVRSIQAEGRLFVDPVRSQLDDHIVIEGLVELLNLARTRMESQNFAGAASTTVKVIGLAGTLHNPRTFAVQDAWLFLAEVHVEYGDFGRARSLLETANREAHEELKRLKEQGAESQPLLVAYQADWTSRSQRVQRIMASKSKRR